MEELLEQLADIFDEDEVKGTDVLEDFEEYDSLSVLTIISFIGQKYNKTLTAKQVRECKTAQDLYNLIKE